MGEWVDEWVSGWVDEWVSGWVGIQWNMKSIIENIITNCYYAQ